MPLYPPLVNTYMPAFNKSGVCQIYFSPTTMNSASALMASGHVQLTLNYMDSNTSALNTIGASGWPNEIKICQIKLDNAITTDYKYYVEINPIDVKGGSGFAIGQYYKVQLRFSSASAISFLTDPGANWYAASAAYFSEWSRVCLIKGIPIPTISNLVFTPEDMSLSARYSCLDPSEPVKNYYMTIAKTATPSNILATSDILYPLSTEYWDASGVINSLFYRPNVNLDTATSYTFAIGYITKNDYSATAVLTASGNYFTASGITAVSASADSDNGRVLVAATRGVAGGTGIFLVRRADHKSDFTLYYDIYQGVLASGAATYNYYDYSAESGNFYKYWVSGSSGSVAIMPVYEDIFLVGNNKQLKIKYDPQVSSFKYNVADSRTDTLGSRFPFIRRNGDMKYREFSIGGLISVQGDENNLFVSAAELAGGSANISSFQGYNASARITPEIDYIKERQFRDKVIDFLYDGEVKLFKSTTEGNAIVRLLDISFSPVDSLGRMIYHFSGTAIEVDDYTPANCIKYNLQVI